MKTLLTALFSICLLSGGTAADDTPGKEKDQSPLDNRELHKLRMEFYGEGQEDEMIKGTNVKIRVTVHIRSDKTVWCTVIPPDNYKGMGCRAHLTGFEPHFSSGLRDGEDYLLEGMIVEDEICYGAFWIYASRLTRAEQGVAPQSATRSESDSEGGDKPQPESEKRSR